MPGGACGCWAAASRGRVSPGGRGTFLCFAKQTYSGFKDEVQHLESEELHVKYVSAVGCRRAWDRDGHEGPALQCPHYCGGAWQIAEHHYSGTAAQWLRERGGAVRNGSAPGGRRLRCGASWQAGAGAGAGAVRPGRRANCTAAVSCGGRSRPFCSASSRPSRSLPNSGNAILDRLNCKPLTRPSTPPSMRCPRATCAGNWWYYCARGRGARKPRTRGQDRRGSLQDIASIHVCPREANDRLSPGHWEGDLIKGRRTHRLWARWSAADRCSPCWSSLMAARRWTRSTASRWPSWHCRRRSARRDLRPRQGDRAAQEAGRKQRLDDLLLRPAQPLAARQ